jgi:hypothetical protein
VLYKIRRAEKRFFVPHLKEYQILRPTFSSSSHARFDVIAREESRDPVHDALPPAVVVLLDNVDDGVFLEGELVFLVGRVVVDRDNWSGESKEPCSKERSKGDERSLKRVIEVERLVDCYLFSEQRQSLFTNE